MWNGDAWRWPAYPHDASHYRPMRVPWPRPPVNVPYARPTPPDLHTPHATPRSMPMPRLPSLYRDFNEPKRPAAIRVTVGKGAIRCRLCWDRVDDATANCSYRVQHWQGTLTRECVHVSISTTSFDLTTTPGAWYEAEVTCVNEEGDVIAVGRTRFRAVFSREEMQQMYLRAVDFVGSSMHPFHVLYRCKPQRYYDDIHFRCGGIMERYVKDENGQAASPINGAIDGLFFSARLSPDGTLPPQSPFGDVRMRVPAATLVDPQKYNYYFADFYCNYMTHYVTVVICERGSDTDRFCQLRLVQLDPQRNCFLRGVGGSGQPAFWVNQNVWVEIYYTENIPLAWGKFDKIVATGAGTSRIGGLPHNKNCLKCNLYPVIARKTEQSTTANATPVISANSTFDLVLRLVESREESVQDSADLIEVVCSLVDAVVERELEEVEIDRDARQLCHRLREKLELPSSLQLLDMLSGVVEELDMRCAQLTGLISRHASALSVV